MTGDGGISFTQFIDTITTSWARVSVDVPIPAGSNNVVVNLGTKTSAGSGRIQFDDVDFRLAGASVDETVTAKVGAAVPPAVAAAIAELPAVQGAAPPKAQGISYSKGGVVGTGGRVPIALRFDDDWDIVKSLGLPAELRSRGLPWSAVWCSQLGSNPWNDEVTYDDLRDWVREYGCEVWSHGTNHDSPWSATQATFTANLTREIVQSKADIEAQGLRVMGFAMPGVTGNGYGFAAPNKMATLSDFDSEAGRILLSNYGLVESDATDYSRSLPSDLRFGLGHFTYSDGQTLQRTLDEVDGAISAGRGLELMCHSAYIGNSPGLLSKADVLTLWDYLVTKRDEGLIEVVTPSSLAFANPDSTRRLDLIGNGNFAGTVPVNSFTAWGNWRGVNGTSALIATVTDGPGGASTKVLRSTASGLAYQAHALVTLQGYSGQGFMLDAWVRSVGATGTWRLRVNNPALNHTAGFELTGAATGTWTRVRRCFTVPVTIDSLALFVGAGAGSAAIEWVDVHAHVA